MPAQIHKNVLLTVIIKTVIYRQGSTDTIHRINGTQLLVRYYTRVHIYRLKTIPMHYLERNLKERVTRLLDEGHTVDLAYLDFANAFDSVNHRFLLAKLKASESMEPY